MNGKFRPPTAEHIERNMRLERILIPHARRQRETHYADHSATNNPIARFVHYTSADAALKIIGSKRVWMRNTTCMADYREVQHGYEITAILFQSGQERPILPCA